jgi:predicted MFS family arabinose efflux permease
LRSVVAGRAEQLTDLVGGPARRRAIGVLAAVLSLSAADGGAVGALAAQLESSFRIGNTEIGLLVTVSSLVGSVASLPMGVLADRTSRTRILTMAIALWSASMVITGTSVTFLMLLLTRLALGVVNAAAGPVVASLVGDLFPPADRSRIYGYVLTGELLGAGAGLLIAGEIGAALGWRYAFLALAIPSAVLAWAVPRLLPEPARGGQSWLRPGDEEIRTEDDVANEASAGGSQGGRGETAASDVSQIRRRARSVDGVEPDERLVLREDARSMDAVPAGRYILRVPSNLVLIGASALGYFFYGGLRTFSVLFAEERFGLAQGVVSLLLIVVGAGAVAGTLAGGRLTDRLISQGRYDARMVVAGVAFLAVSLVMLGGVAVPFIALALPVLTVGAAFLGATNPPLDAARLDIMPSQLWGRAEAVRTLARTLFESFAPLLFGFISAVLGGGRSVGFGSGVNPKHSHISAAQGRGLEYTFMLMLIPLAASGILLLRYRRRYLVDVATADQSEKQQSGFASG